MPKPQRKRQPKPNSVWHPTHMHLHAIGESVTVYRKGNRGYSTSHPLLKGPFDSLDQIEAKAYELNPYYGSEFPIRGRKRERANDEAPQSRPPPTQDAEAPQSRPPPTQDDEALQSRPPPTQAKFWSDKLLANVPKLSEIAARNLKAQNVSSSTQLLDATPLDESVTAIPHAATDGSSSSCPFRSEELLAGVTESASLLTLQESDDSSSEQLQPHVSSSMELIDTAEESSSQTVPHNTIDHSPRYSASSGPTIWIRKPSGWYFMFSIRRDQGGSFHMYPDLGGPFPSLQEADDAIDRHLDSLRRPALSNGQDEVSSLESMIQRIIFYPDGMPKRGPNSPSRKYPKRREKHLVQAVLDQFNDDHNLFREHAHELSGDVRFQWISEDNKCYYHFNFWTKTKGAADTAGNLFFAELSGMPRESDWVLSCCCIIEPSKNGLCHGCTRNGCSGMKHPSTIDSYSGGHVEQYLAYGGDSFSDSDDDEEAQAAKLRKKFAPCRLKEGDICSWV